MIGKTAEEVIGEEAIETIAPYHDRASPARRSATSGRRRRDGRKRWMRGRMVPDHRFDGAIQGVYIVGHDITDLKDAQEALAARESAAARDHGRRAGAGRLYRPRRALPVRQPHVPAVFRPGRRAGGELRLRDVVGHGIYASAQAMLSRALEGESTSFDRLVPGADGARRWMTIRVVPDATPTGEVHGAFVLMNDIHGLKQAQEALRASESELRLIMDNVPARVAYIDRDYRFRFLNRHNEEWLRMSRNELTGRRVAEVVGEARFRQLQPMLERVLAGETVSIEQMLAQPSGEERWESIHYAPNRDADGSVIGIYAVHTDIHDQKRNEEALRRANWMLSSHINNTPLAVLEWDRDSGSCAGRRRPSSIFGWRADEVLGMPIDAESAVHEADRDAVPSCSRG